MTPEDLVDMEGVKRAKYTYLRCLDQKDWDGLRDVLATDATAAYSGGRYTYSGRDEIVDFIVKNMGADTFHSSHRVHHPEIDIDGDTATATWALEDIVFESSWNFLLMGAAFYTDTYVRDGDRWLIQDTRYRRSFEFTMPSTSIEGFNLTASWWGTDGQSSLPVI